MSAKKTPETLEEYLKTIMSMARTMSDLAEETDKKYGVSMRIEIRDKHYMTPIDISLRRGMEEVEKALGEEAKTEKGWGTPVKRLKHYGVEFTQYADDKTKVFVKAGKEPPKVVIVDE